MKPILEFRGEYRFLSNFYPCYFTILGNTFSSAEHAYQAMKFRIGSKGWLSVQSAVGPGAAKRAGRAYPPDFIDEKHRLDSMLIAVRAKFTQNVDLRAKLLATEDTQLEEGNHWNDRFWGVCPAGTGWGENHLGKILMQVRQELNQK